MNRRALVRTTVLSLPLVLGLSACESVGFGKLNPFRQDSAGLEEVDGFLQRIEKVHVECELSRQAMREATRSLHAIVSGQTTDDPVTAYQGFVKVIEGSELRLKELRGSVTPMKKAAGPFFERWAADLGAFSSPEMRQRSESRLTETRDRYEAIVAAVDPTLASYGVFNQGLRDHALFLSNDFNAAAVAEIEVEARNLTRLAGELDQRFATCLEALRAYVEKAALHVRTETTPAADEPR